MKYLLSPAAQADLADAARYGDATFGLAETDRYFAELDQVMQLLAEFPLMARERPEFDPPVRIHHHGRHYVVYRALKAHVRVLRILSDRSDLGRHLKQLG